MHSADSLSDVKKRLLKSFLHSQDASAFAQESRIDHRPNHLPAPLSFSQRQMLRRELKTPGVWPLYNECITLRMLEPIDPSLLEHSFQQIVSRHEAWQTNYQEVNGELLQVVNGNCQQTRFEIVDLTRFSRETRETIASSLVREMVQKPFQLSAERLLRTQLIRFEDSEYRLYIAAHLSIVDGVSAYQVFPRELAAAYSSALAGQASRLPLLPVQFADYASWQQRWMQGPESNRQIEYWRQKLGPQIHEFDWPHRRSSSRPRGFRGAIRSFEIPAITSAAMKDLCRKECVTVFAGLTAALTLLISLLSEATDILIATPAPGGRKRSQLQGLLGHFLNPVLLRFNTGGDPSVRDLLQQAQILTMEALSNDEVPLEMALDTLGSVDTPLFRTAISLQPPMPDVGRPWTVTSMDVDSGGSPWELYLAFIDTSKGMLGRAQYNPDVHQAAAVTRIVSDFKRLLEAIITDPLRRLSELKSLATKLPMAVA